MDAAFRDAADRKGADGEKVAVGLSREVAEKQRVLAEQADELISLQQHQRTLVAKEQQQRQIIGKTHHGNTAQIP